MDSMTQKKTAEAQQHISDAEKSLKTSLFKRKPDLDSAASYYNSAAMCFKVIKDLNKAIECYEKSADCYKQNNSLYNAAKQYEQVAYMANESKNYSLCLDKIMQAADLMLTSGTRDSAGIILERAANMIKLNAPEKALQIYKKAIYVADVEDKNHEMVVFYEQAISLALKTNDYNDAIQLINDSLKILDKIGTVEQITKCILSIVIIHLSRDDWVAAKSYLDNVKKNYDVAPGSGGFSRIDELLETYEEKDDEKLKNIIKNYLSYAVDNEVLKIANKITKTEEWIKESQNASKKVVLTKPNSDNVIPVCYNQTGSNSDTNKSSNTVSAPVNNSGVEEEDEFDDLK